MATGTATRKGISLACPHCQAQHDDDNRGVCLEVGSLTLFCAECSEAISRADLERVKGEVDRLLRLLELAASV